MTGTENLVTSFLVSNKKGKRKLWEYEDNNFSDWLLLPARLKPQNKNVMGKAVKTTGQIKPIGG